jgi:SAM-dependent MidA family methyltransferase
MEVRGFLLEHEVEECIDLGHRFPYGLTNVSLFQTTPRAEMNKVAEIIRAEINSYGSMSFARFMELALYCPDYGYYEKIEDKVGRLGDFYTSVSVGSLFGQLLAVRFSQWFDGLAHKALLRQSAPTVGNGCDSEKALAIVEGGAHDGQLALDVLNWFQTHRQDQFERLRYCIVEPSRRRQAIQQRQLAGFANQVSWVRDLGHLRCTFAPDTFHGVIFSNELLDAMPVQLYRWNAALSGWIEWGVSLQNDGFSWVPLSQRPIPFGQLLAVHFQGEAGNAGADEYSKLSSLLPDGFPLEVSPSAINWWKSAANCLDHGWLLTFDYGGVLEEMLAPTRIQGTLRAYRKHHVLNDVLVDPGEQDITAHVDFTALRRSGESCGLKTEELSPQYSFLTRAASTLWQLYPGDWNSKSTRQFGTLTHPDHLGRNFRVMVQSRDVNS